MEVIIPQHSVGFQYFMLDLLQACHTCNPWQVKNNKTKKKDKRKRAEKLKQIRDDSAGPQHGLTIIVMSVWTHTDLVEIIIQPSQQRTLCRL